MRLGRGEFYEEKNHFFLLKKMKIDKPVVCPGCELAEGESFMGGTVGTTVATIENHHHLHEDDYVGDVDHHDD